MTRQIWQLRGGGLSESIREYQTVREMRDDVKLASFLGDNLAPLLRPFEADVIVIGGGLTEHRGFFQKLGTELKARGISSDVRSPRQKRRRDRRRAALRSNTKALTQ